MRSTLAKKQRSMQRRLGGWCLLVAVAALVFQAGPLAAEDWPQFRGPNCSGVSLSKKPLPVHFSPTKNVSWMAALADAVSSPAVAGGRVFATAMVGPRDGAQKFLVFAFDALTGQKLWQ